MSGQVTARTGLCPRSPLPDHEGHEREGGPVDCSGHFPAPLRGKVTPLGWKPVAPYPAGTSARSGGAAASSRRPVMCRRPGTVRHHPNFMPTRPRRSTKSRLAAIKRAATARQPTASRCRRSFPRQRTSGVRIRGDPPGGKCHRAVLGVGHRNGRMAENPRWRFGAVIAVRGEVADPVAREGAGEVQAARVTTMASVPRTPSNPPRAAASFTPPAPGPAESCEPHPYLKSA